jgi:hypothetical protein
MNALNQVKKAAVSLKTYASLSFIIFSLPFLQTCSDKQLKDNIKNDFSKEKLLELKKENTFNAYGITYNILSDFKSEELKVVIFYAYLLYPIIIVLAILIFVQSFRSRFKSIFYLTSLSTLLFILSILLLIYIGVVQNINQLKIGWYLFLLNSLFMIYLSYQKGFKETIS